MRRLLRVVPYIILAIAMLLLYQELQHLKWEELRRTLISYSWTRFALAFALLILNYIVWSGYDWTSLKQMNLRVPYVQIFRTTSVAFPITNLVGYSLITGFATRVRKYERFGISFPKITQLILFNISTWWVGFLFLCGAAIVHAPDGKLFHTTESGAGWIGIGLLASVALYLVLCWWWEGKEFRFRRWSMHLPTLDSGCRKILVSVADNLIVGMTMFVFMPSADDISFARFMAYFLSATLVALLSLVPAGFGVLEGIVLYLFRPYAGDAEILASLVLFRVFHYLLPVFFALVYEIGRKLRPAAAG